jgi:hypothetical protein
VAELGGAAVGVEGLTEAAALAQQPPEVERAVGVTTVCGTPERLLGADQVVSVLQQASEARGTLVTAQRVGPPVGGLSGREIPLLIELKSQL